MKHIVMYSGGIGSWAAAKRVIEQHGKENVILLFTDTQIEDEDLYRFLTETTRVFGCKLEWIEDGRDPWEVFKDSKWIGNSRVAQCSTLLKQKPARKWIEDNFKPDECILYVGIDWSEIHRFEGAEKENGERKKGIVDHWLPYTVKAPMCEEPLLSKYDMIKDLEKKGIEQPRLYKMNFSHNNCGGFCVRAGQGHFLNLLQQKRDLYLYHENKEIEMQKYLERDDVSILTRIREGVEYTLTLRQLREEWENNERNIDITDIGGCGCFAQYEEDSR